MWPVLRAKPFPNLTQVLIPPCCRFQNRLEWCRQRKNKYVPPIEDFDDVVKTHEDEHKLNYIRRTFRSLEYFPSTLTTEFVGHYKDYSYAAIHGKLLAIARKENTKMAKALRAGFVDKYNQDEPYQKFFDDNNRPIYNRHNNTMFMYNADRNRVMIMNERKLRMALDDGQKLVVDFSFNHRMRWRQHSSLANQITFIHSANAYSKNPFDLWLTSFENPNEKFLQAFFSTKRLTTFSSLYIHTTPEPPQKIFNPEDLIFLSPHADEEMQIFDQDKTYIIGGLVDTWRNDEVETSASRAREYGIKSLRLPLLIEARNNKAPRLDLMTVFKILVLCKNDGFTVSAAIKECLHEKWYDEPTAQRLTKLKEERKEQQILENNCGDDDKEVSLSQ